MLLPPFSIVVGTGSLDDSEFSRGAPIRVTPLGMVILPLKLKVPAGIYTVPPPELETWFMAAFISDADPLAAVTEVAADAGTDGIPYPEKIIPIKHITTINLYFMTITSKSYLIFSLMFLKPTSYL
jgi:hypothetical protein